VGSRPRGWVGRRLPGDAEDAADLRRPGRLDPVDRRADLDRAGRFARRGQGARLARLVRAVPSMLRLALDLRDPVRRERLRAGP
jgi:hypothetical protein